MYIKYSRLSGLFVLVNFRKKELCGKGGMGFNIQEQAPNIHIRHLYHKVKGLVKHKTFTTTKRLCGP
jgi:hypothetical protein